ncbi:MAG: sigma 54-interacting transcriptional regulator [Deltaproteobacteria bacterium]|nr:sigma 54-interacting transcriptional regulator [Deltaproteobacteria bacterium]
MASEAPARFQLLRPLGKGWLGEVYLARDRECGEELALKFLRKPLDPQAERLFQREVRLLARLSHPNLVRIHDFFPSQSGLWQAAAHLEEKPALDSACFSMEYLSGGDLAQPAAPLQPGDWLRIAAQLLSALEVLHGRQILHCDLKPGNILLGRDQKPKILDFGFALRLRDARRPAGPRGTLAYMAPETFWGEYDRRSDLFSLGVLLYECLCGSRPFPRILSGAWQSVERPRALRELRPDLPADLEDLVSWLLELKPADRPSSARAALRFLERHERSAQTGSEDAAPEGELPRISLIGRESELQRVRLELDKPASEGTAPLFLVHGPLGSGRSRLIEEVKWECQLRGFGFESLETLCRVEPPDEAEWLRRAETALVAWREQPRALACLDAHLWEVSALRRCRVLLSLLGAAGLRLPVFLEFDHDPNPPELHALAWEGVAGFRSVEIPLRDLSREEVRQFLREWRGGLEAEEGDLQALWEACGGRPLFLAERLCYGGLGLRGARLRSIAEKVRTLSGAARDLLAMVALHPFPIGPELWEGGDWGLPDAEAALAELDSWGFLAFRSAESPQIRLQYPALRERYLDLYAEPERGEFHRRWKRVLADFVRGREPSGEACIARAHHAYALREGEEVLRHGLSAAQACEAEGRIEEALEWYRRMEEFAERPRDLVEIHGRSAPLYYRLGRYSEALDAYDRWFRHREDDATFLQKAKHRFYTGLVRYTAGEDAKARELFLECLAIGEASDSPPSHHPYQARCLSFLAAMEEKGGREDAALKHLQSARERAGGDAMLLGEIEQRWGQLEQGRLNYAEAEAHFEAALGHYRGAGNAQSEAVALQFLGTLDRERGRWAEAEERLGRAVEISRRSGPLLQWARYAFQFGLVKRDRAEYGAALQEMSKAQGLMKILGTDADRALSDLDMADLYYLLGDFAAGDRKAESPPGRAGDDAPLAEATAWLRVRRALCRGAWEEARGHAEGALRDANLARHPAFRRSFSETLFRLRWRQGQTEPPEWGEALLALEAGRAPYLRDLWRAALALFAGDDAPERVAERFPGFFQALEGCEEPELLQDFLESLVYPLETMSLAATASECRRLARHVGLTVAQALPEELKMDFEKNRGLKNLDAALSAKLSAGAAPPPAIPAATPPAPAEAGAKISEPRFRQYSEIVRQIAQKKDLEEILERIMDAAVELTGAERGFLLLKVEKPAGGPLPGFEVRTARNFNRRALDSQDFKISLSAVELALVQGSFLLTENAQLDPRLKDKESVMLYELKSILVVPLSLQGEVTGVIYLDHRYQPERFQEEDRIILNAFAAHAALSIEKAQLIRSLMETQKKLEEALAARERRIVQLDEELAKARDQLRFGYEEIIGQSPEMIRIFQVMDQVSETSIPVWIHGESGTGKELIARALHRNSPRRDKPFVSENCSAIPENLLESELFGYKKGAFTHADRDRIGLLEAAHGGTLFLDEVADMSPGMQAKLLRVLQEGEIRPLGSQKKVKIDVRLVAVSNLDLEQLANQGKFRQDLFFRINGITLHLPPLRRRKEDIPLLVNYFLQKLSRELKVPAAEIGDEAFALLMRHPWPGNIRQLEGVIRNALLFARGRTITPELLPLAKEGAKEEGVKGAADASVPETAEEKHLIMEALRRARMDKETAAKDLGIGLRTLYTKMDLHRIPKKKAVLIKFLGLEKTG